jgi:hypothetical protein
MNNLHPQNYIPFVYIVDSPSPSDDKYSIGMALRDVLTAIHISVIYTQVFNRTDLGSVLGEQLKKCIDQYQVSPSSNAYPFIHLCMHGNQEGVSLIDGTTIKWSILRQMLLSHNDVKGYNPLVCMASCYGFHALSMINDYDSVFHYLVGHTGAVGQSDLTVAYLAFYHHIFLKNSIDIEQAVEAMKVASGDTNFHFAHGDTIQQYRRLCLQPYIRMTQTGRIAQHLDFNQ